MFMARKEYPSDSRVKRNAAPIPTGFGPLAASARALVEEIVDLPGGLGADAWHLGEIGERCSLDRFEGSEVMQECPLAGWAYARDFLQAGLADVASPPLPMRTDRKSMRLVAQPLHKIEHRIARLELERFPARRRDQGPWQPQPTECLRRR